MFENPTLNKIHSEPVNIFFPTRSSGNKFEIDRTKFFFKPASDFILDICPPSLTTNTDYGIH